MIKDLFTVAAIFFLFFSCEQNVERSPYHPLNWKSRAISLNEADSLKQGSTYLSVYSQIYERTEERTYDLTATISIRNISSTDSIFITKAEYYNTRGDLIRSYFEGAIYLQPLETVEIVIAQSDKMGGTGANFIFDWAIPEGVHEPLFEAVMISTSGQQGISFTTQGIKR